MWPASTEIFSQSTSSAGTMVWPVGGALLTSTSLASDGHSSGSKLSSPLPECWRSQSNTLSTLQAVPIGACPALHGHTAAPLTMAQTVWLAAVHGLGEHGVICTHWPFFS